MGGEHFLAVQPQVTVSTSLSLGQNSDLGPWGRREGPRWTPGAAAQGLGIHAGDAPATLCPMRKVPCSGHPVGLESLCRQAKAPSYPSQTRTSPEPHARASHHRGGLALWGSAQLLEEEEEVKVTHAHTRTYTHSLSLCCCHGGKASWQRGHPGWAAAPSAAPKLLITGKLKKTKPDVSLSSRQAGSGVPNEEHAAHFPCLPPLQP